MNKFLLSHDIKGCGRNSFSCLLLRINEKKNEKKNKRMKNIYKSDIARDLMLSIFKVLAPVWIVVIDYIQLRVMRKCNSIVWIRVDRERLFSFSSIEMQMCHSIDGKFENVFKPQIRWERFFFAQHTSTWHVTQQPGQCLHPCSQHTMQRNNIDAGVILKPVFRKFSHLIDSCQRANTLCWVKNQFVFNLWPVKHDWYTF